METHTFLTPEFMDTLAGVVTQLFAFIAFLWILKRYAWKPLLKILDDRQQSIENEFKKIESLEKKYQDLHDQYACKLKEIDSEARQKFQEEIKHGRELSQNITAAAHRDAQDIIAKTKIHVEAEIVKARLLLKDELSRLVIQVSEKLIREKLDEKKQRELIQSFVAEVEKQV